MRQMCQGSSRLWNFRTLSRPQPRIHEALNRLESRRHSFEPSCTMDSYHPVRVCVCSPLAHAVTGSLPQSDACSWPHVSTFSSAGGTGTLEAAFALEALLQWPGYRVKTLTLSTCSVAPAPRLDQQVLAPRIEHRAPHSKDFHTCLWLNIADSTPPESKFTAHPSVCL